MRFRWVLIIGLLFSQMAFGAPKKSKKKKMKPPRWGMNFSYTRSSQQDKELETSPDDTYLIDSFDGEAFSLQLYLEYYIKRQWYVQFGLAYRNLRSEGDARLSSAPSSSSEFRLAEDILLATLGTRKRIWKRLYMGADGEFGRSINTDLKVLDGPQIDTSSVENRFFGNLYATAEYRIRRHKKKRGLIIPRLRWGAILNTDPLTYLVDFGVSYRF